ncbi:MAG: P-II family nitrogen regulator [Candidatus Bathyarchaeia archaeon]
MELGTMVKIEAIVRCERFPEVKDALAAAGFQSLTAYNVKGRGKQLGHELNFRGRTHRVDLLPKIKVELVVDNADLERVEVIREKAYTGEIGDGKVFVFPVADVIRVRTFERGREAV